MNAAVRTAIAVTALAGGILLPRQATAHGWETHRRMVEAATAVMNRVP